jgi:transcriptional regulator with XRE-family HTH domain
MAESGQGETGINEAEGIDRKALGARLRESREYIGLSQEEVAKILSIPRTALSNIETGRRRVDALELKELAKLYKRPVAYFTGTEAFTEGLPKDVEHLARAVSDLSPRDREELTRFAEYLRARAQVEPENHG